VSFAHEVPPSKAAFTVVLIPARYRSEGPEMPRRRITLPTQNSPLRRQLRLRGPAEANEVLVFTSDQPIATVLELVNPLRPHWHLVDEDSAGIQRRSGCTEHSFSISDDLSLSVGELTIGLLGQRKLQGDDMRCGWFMGLISEPDITFVVPHADFDHLQVHGRSIGAEFRFS
jgi:hypothetical protein